MLGLGQRHRSRSGRFRTKKELAKLVRDLNPLPQVPDRMEPLGPAPASPLRNPTWTQYVESLCPPVRELAAGERPRDWASDGVELEEGDALPVGPVPSSLPPVTAPQHYQMQFETVEEHAKLVERAKALLSHEQPGVTLGALHFEAMRMLVAALENRKFAVTERSRKRAAANELPRSAAATAPDQSPPQREAPRSNDVESPRRRGAKSSSGSEPSRQHGTKSSSGSKPSRQLGRYIPAAERREAYQRDGGCCTYLDARGERCRETHYLELHHLKPFAQKGPNLASNLTLRCAAHNALAAEEDFGRDLITRRRDQLRHESFVAQTNALEKG